MGQTQRVTTVVVEIVEDAYDAVRAAAHEDGVITLAEQRAIKRMREAMQAAGIADASLMVAHAAVRADGIASSWYQRKSREALEDVARMGHTDDAA